MATRRKERDWFTELIKAAASARAAALASKAAAEAELARVRGQLKKEKKEKKEKTDSFKGKHEKEKGDTPAESKKDTKDKKEKKGTKENKQKREKSPGCLCVANPTTTTETNKIKTKHGHRTKCNQRNKPPSIENSPLTDSRKWPQSVPGKPVFNGFCNFSNTEMYF